MMMSYLPILAIIIILQCLSRSTRGFMPLIDVGGAAAVVRSQTAWLRTSVPTTGTTTMTAPRTATAVLRPDVHSLSGEEEEEKEENRESNKLAVAHSTSLSSSASSSSSSPLFSLWSSRSFSRRSLFTKTTPRAAASAIIMVCGGLMTASSVMHVSAASAASASMGTQPDAPIVVLGAGGKVGKLCTQILAQQKGLYTRAVTRSGNAVLSSNKNTEAEDTPTVSYAAGDVTQLESIKSALRGASGVIFAASASGPKKGGDPAHVDYLGVYNTALACLALNIPKLVVVSAGTVTRPESAGFKATNFFVKYVYGDNIMDYKIAGEAALRDVYANSGKSGLAYTVIRPGGLSDKASVGSTQVHVSQGDVYSSEVTREDVAQVTVAALLKGPATDFCTFELNQMEGLGKAEKQLPDLPKELVHAGAPTYDALLDGLVKDSVIKAQYPDIINDFRGAEIEPVNKLA